MCYSAEVSFLTWGFGMACAAILAFTGQPVLSFLFPLVITQMQLVEGLRWIHALPEPLLAGLGKAALYAQPIAAMMEAGDTRWITVYSVTQGLLEGLVGSRDTRFVVASDGHFEWKWTAPFGSLGAIPYWIGLIYGATRLYPSWVNAGLLGLLAYYVAAHHRYGTWGSLWCVSVNLLWIYYLLR